MTDLQIKFLLAILQEPKTAKQICEELAIEGNKIDPLGGYYNALNEAIGYLTSDEKQEIDDMFEILSSGSAVSDNDIYSITSAGEQYLSARKI